MVEEKVYERQIRDVEAKIQGLIEQLNENLRSLNKMKNVRNFLDERIKISQHNASEYIFWMKCMKLMLK